MFEWVIIGFGAAAILGGPVLARVVGWLVSRQLRSSFGHSRDWMPTLPNNTVLDPDAQRRWEKRARRIEGRLLSHLIRHPIGASAEGLSGVLGEDVEIVGAALARVRDEVPVRLQVTRKGQLLHEFDPKDLESLKQKQGLRIGLGLVLYVLAIGANIGAAWPVLLSIFVALLGMAGMVTLAEPVLVGGFALVVTALVLGLNVGLGWFVHFVLTPLGSPRLGSVEMVEDRGMLEEPHQARSTLMHGSVEPVADVGCAGAEGCASIDDVGGLAVLIFLVLLSVVLMLSFAVLIWLRGLWRSIMRIGRADATLSPTAWIRGAKPADRIEKLIPTNDLVLRVVSVLRRLTLRTHPEDAGMVSRVLGLAHKNAGRVGVREIMLWEGLDESAAMSVGAQLVGYLNGEIFVGDEGEVEFLFPMEVLQQPGTPDQELNAEYLDLKGNVRRRRAQNKKRVPSNIPGLDYGHIVATDRLVAGTILMQISAMLVVHLVPNVPMLVMVGVDFVFPMMTLGAFALSGAARWAMSEMARHGVQRDIRRAGYVAVRESRHGEVNFEELSETLHDVFRKAWPSLKRRDVLAELEGVALDLDLDPCEAPYVYSTQSVQVRLESLEVQRRAAPPVRAEDDEVVFDTRIEHERIYAM